MGHLDGKSPMSRGSLRAGLHVRRISGQPLLDFLQLLGFTAERPLRAAVGGAPPTKETIAAVQQMGITVTHLYGLTETYGPSLVCEYQPGWTELPAADLAGRLSRQGVPAISVADAQIADDKLRPLPADGTSTGRS